MKYKLLDLIKKQYSLDYDDISDDLSNHYYDSGSFSNVYYDNEDNVMIKVLFNINNLSFITSYLSDNSRSKLKEMMLSLAYDDKEYTDRDYLLFLQSQFKEESLKLSCISKYIDSYPKVLNYTNEYFLMEKKEGKPLYSLKHEDINNIPKDCWLQLIDDLYKVNCLGYRPIDVSENNILWSEIENKFNIIDVGLYIKDNSMNLHLPKFLKEEKYKDIKEFLDNHYLFDNEYEELTF